MNSNNRLFELILCGQHKIQMIQIKPSGVGWNPACSGRMRRRKHFAAGLHCTVQMHERREVNCQGLDTFEMRSCRWKYGIRKLTKIKWNKVCAGLICILFLFLVLWSFQECCRIFSIKALPSVQALPILHCTQKEGSWAGFLSFHAYSQRTSVT